MGEFDDIEDENARRDASSSETARQSSSSDASSVPGPSSPGSAADPVADPTAGPAADPDNRPVHRQNIGGSIKVQQHETARRVPEVVDACHRLLPAVAALGQVDTRSDPPDFVRQRAVIGLEADPRNGGGYAKGVERPGARPLRPVSEPSG